MIPDTTVQTKSQLVESGHSGDFLRLMRLWAQRNHFSLVFAAVDNTTYREGLIERLQLGHVVKRIDLTAGDMPEDWLNQLEAASMAGATRVHTVFPLTAFPAAWWQTANVLRERLADAFSSLNLMWLSDQDIDTAAHHAPDLWNWREAVFSFTRAVPMALPPLTADRFSPRGDAEEAAVKQRVAAIEDYLKQGTADPATTGHLRLEVAQAYERLGELDASEAAARVATQCFLLAGNDHLAAQAKGQIAHILQARGDLDEALRIRKDEQLPVLERLGDVRSVLVARANLAQLFWMKDRVAHADEARDLLERALSDAQRLRLPEAGQILDLQAAMGFLPALADGANGRLSATKAQR